jgi:hypothetical protein
METQLSQNSSLQSQDSELLKLSELFLLQALQGSQD